MILNGVVLAGAIVALLWLYNYVSSNVLPGRQGR